MDEEIVDQRSRSFGLRLPAHVVDRMDEECKRLRVSRTQYILSLFENRNDPSPGRPNESSAPDLSGFVTEVIESLRAEIRAGLTVPAVSPPPDLSPVLDAIKDLSFRIGAMESPPAPVLSESPAALSPLFSRLDDILELLRSSRPSGETESEAHALSFLSLQMGEIQQGIERLFVQMDALARSGRHSGAGTSPEIKDELIRLSEAAEHQSALTGEILRIGDSVREIRDRLQKNPTTAAPLEKIPEKVSRKEARYKEPDPAAEKKKETRQFGWAVGILLVFFLGFVGWEILGWYNGGDSGGPPIIHPSPSRPKIPDGAPKTQNPPKKNP